ncbi:MAG: FHA domain-containing protein [Planctomycetota bacterium]
MSFYLNFLQHGRLQVGDVEISDPVTVGREPECKVALPHESVSRHHATFTLDAGTTPPHVLLRDEGSTNGTLVNGRVYQGQTVGVRPGDVIQIGVYRVELLQAHSSAQSHPEDSGASRIVCEADPRSPAGLPDGRLSAIHDLLQELPRLRGPAVIESAAKALSKALPAEVAYIFLEAESGFPVTATWRGTEPCRPEHVSVDKSLVQAALERGVAVLAESGGAPEGDEGPPGRVTSISAPISARGKTCGAIYLRSPAGAPYAKEDLQALLLVAGLVGLRVAEASAAEAASRDREKLEEILANLPDGVILVDAEDAIVACNAAACRMLGDEALVGRRLSEVLTAIDPGLPPRLILSRTAFELRKVSAVRPQDGGPAVKTYGGVWGSNPGKSGTGWKHALCLRDVTREKQRSQFRLRLLGKLAQDVVQPFTVVTAVNTLVAQRVGTSGDPQLAEVLALSEKNSETCADLLRRFVDLAAAEAKTEVPAAVWCTCPLEELVAASIRRFAALFREKRFKIVQAFHSGTVALEGDRNRLQAIFDQLIHNAVKHGKAGGSLILGVEAEGARAKISFLDDGPGISLSAEGVRKKIFCEVDPSRFDEIPDVGLGLWLVSDAVCYHEGKIRISSPANEDGTGTLVQVVLPGAVASSDSSGSADTLRLPFFSYAAEKTEG